MHKHRLVTSPGVRIAAGTLTVALAGLGVALGTANAGPSADDGKSDVTHSKSDTAHGKSDTAHGSAKDRAARGNTEGSTEGNAQGDNKGAAGQGSDAVPTNVKVMTWNVCANTTPYRDDKGQKLCANGGQTDKVARGIRWHMNQYKDLNATLFQEICYADIQKLRTLDGMQNWKFRFLGSKDRGTAEQKGAFVDRKCGKGRGAFGVAVGVKDTSAKATYHPYAIKNVPNARDAWKHWNVQEGAVCLDGLGARFCATHLTPWKGGHKWSDLKASEFLTSQRGEVEELAALGKGKKRVVLGGDLNASPQQSSELTGPMLDPLYDGYKECSQDANGGARTGKPTYQLPSGERGQKLDHVFTNKSATASCSVTDQHVTLSDHLPVAATVTFS